MHIKIEQHIETLLHGGKSEARKAKDALKKEIARASQPSWKTKEQAKRDRNIFSKEMLSIYGKLFDSYGSIKNHNKTLVLGFLSHALFYFEDSHTYFEMFLVHVREALKDTLDGNLRHVAVTTASNTFAISTMWWSRTLCIGVSSKHEKISQQYQEILLQHLTEIFDTLETIIEKDEDNFPDAVETMKPSVVKSHLLYTFDLDRFNVLSHMSGLYEDTSLFDDNEHYKKWTEFYQAILKNHPHVEKFIKHVPRFDVPQYEEYDASDVSKIVQGILDTPEEEGILSPQFFFRANQQEQEDALGGFSIPKESYFRIMGIVSDVDDTDELFNIFNIVYIHAWQSSVSEIYWYDLVDFILSKYNDIPLRLKILKEALTKLSSKVDVHVPIHQDTMNSIHYGIHEHRPIFRILIAYALYHHEYGDKEIAKQYYSFLLKLNPGDNQGVRYLFAALYAGKPPTYTDELFVEGNKTQNWDKVENFLDEQNTLHHFWDEPI